MNNTLNQFKCAKIRTEFNGKYQFEQKNTIGTDQRCDSKLLNDGVKITTTAKKLSAKESILARLKLKGRQKLMRDAAPTVGLEPTTIRLRA